MPDNPSCFHAKGVKNDTENAHLRNPRHPNNNRAEHYCAKPGERLC